MMGLHQSLSLVITFTSLSDRPGGDDGALSKPTFSTHNFIGSLPVVGWGAGLFSLATPVYHHLVALYG